MKTMSKIMKSLVASALAVGLALTIQTADAGRGSSVGSVYNAINSGGSDAIISELERAEKIICAQCVDMVVPLLDHDDYRVREVAAWWVSKRPNLAELVTADSLDKLATGTTIEARNAADAVGTFRHPRVVTALSNTLDRSDLGSEARLAVTRALGTIGHPAGAPAVERSMQDPDPTVRFTALTAWQLIRHRTAASGAVALLNDSDLKVRRQATALMGVYKMDSTREALEAQLQDPDPGVRRNAAWSLGQIGSVGSRDALIAATNDESGLVRRVASASLGMLR
jgi:HEAT repeat protein